MAFELNDQRRALLLKMAAEELARRHPRLVASFRLNLGSEVINYRVDFTWSAGLQVRDPHSGRLLVQAVPQGPFTLAKASQPSAGNAP